MEKSKLLKFSTLMDAAVVAEKAIAGMERGSRLVIPGLTNKIGVQAVRFAPRHLITRLVKRIQEADTKAN